MFKKDSVKIKEEKSKYAKGKFCPMANCYCDPACVCLKAYEVRGGKYITSCTNVSLIGDG